MSLCINMYIATFRKLVMQPNLNQRYVQFIEMLFNYVVERSVLIIFKPNSETTFDAFG